VSAIRHGHVYEIKSTYILQPGPAALTEGVQQLHRLLSQVVGVGSLTGGSKDPPLHHRDQ
jgi:hypothetical protein